MYIVADTHSIFHLSYALVLISRAAQECMAFVWQRDFSKSLTISELAYLFIRNLIIFLYFGTGHRLLVGSAPLFFLKKVR